jgi:alpha-N-arabinofuranosidase
LVLYFLLKCFFAEFIESRMMSQTRISIRTEDSGVTINPNLYGHFSEHLGRCIYDGLWVGEDSSIPNMDGIRRDVVDALKRIAPPVLRWPGGCFADGYHWRDGIGPRASRPKRVSHWWWEAEPNAFGTHEFMRLCQLIGAKPYFAGNVGSGTPDELAAWVEYCNYGGDTALANERRANGSDAPFNVEYWGVGNELWGCGGHMEPDDYALEYRRFATHIPSYPGSELKLVACGPAGNGLDWTRRFFEKLGNYKRIYGFAAHYYAVDKWPPNEPEMGTATNFSHSQWYNQLMVSLRVEKLILDQRALMDEFDPERRVGLILDEWGTWFVEHESNPPGLLGQQNTMRDALVAASTLDIFNRHADKLVMGNIAQIVNVLQSPILTEGERMILTPTYHVFDLYQAHQGAALLPLTLESDDIAFEHAGVAGSLPRIVASASRKGRTVTLSVVNMDADQAVEAAIDLGVSGAVQVTTATLAGEGIAAHNTYDAPDAVTPTRTTSEWASGRWTQHFPPASVTVLTITV